MNEFWRGCRVGVTNSYAPEVLRSNHATQASWTQRSVVQPSALVTFADCSMTQYMYDAGDQLDRRQCHTFGQGAHFQDALNRSSYPRRDLERANVVPPVCWKAVPLSGRLRQTHSPSSTLRRQGSQTEP
jgi:hypothetical protein